MRKKDFFIDVGMVYLSALVKLCIPLYLFPLFSGRFENADFSRLALLYSYSIVIGVLLDLGISLSGPRLVASECESGSNSAPRILWAVSVLKFGVWLCIALVVMLIGFVSGRDLMELFLMVVLGGFMGNSYAWYYNIQNKRRVYALIESISVIFGVLLSYIFIDSPDLAMLNLVLIYAIPVMLGIFLVPYHGGAALNRKIMKKIILYGKYPFLFNLITVGYTSGYVVYVNNFIGKSLVGAFFAIDYFVRTVCGTIQPLTRIIYAKICHIYNNDGKERVVELSKLLFIIYIIMGIFLAGALNLFSDNVLGYIYRNEYKEFATTTYHVLIWMIPIIWGSSALGMFYYLPRRDDKKFITCILVGLGSNLLLAPFFISFFSSTGASLNLILAESVVLIFMIYFRKGKHGRF